MAAGIPFMEETGRKVVRNGGNLNSKNDHGFCTLFVTFERKNLLLLLLTSHLSLFYSFELHNKMAANLPFSFNNIPFAPLRHKWRPNLNGNTYTS